MANKSHGCQSSSIRSKSIKNPENAKNNTPTEIYFQDVDNDDNNETLFDLKIFVKNLR
ncbi:4785_t:CDS:2 [Diversispora eburnea]|uniref:4785_t:CDS:1 n=1 Tax=Diversispora eburnea TaxID=1213867 RepID=A0A9N8ZCX4_9GLOM|nr:4785_t:CDS:2 [Diversispora eburnea]